MDKLRLLIVGISWPPETFIYNLIEGLSKAGVEVTVATASKGCCREGDLKLKWIFTPSWRDSIFIRLLRLVWVILNVFLRLPLNVRLLIKHLILLLNYQSAILYHSSVLINRLYILYRNLLFVGRCWDVIYFPWNSAAIAYLPLFNWGCPVVVSCRGAQVNIAPHNPKRYNIREELKVTFQKATFVHCVSENIKQEAIKYGLNPRKAFVIPPAVDSNFFHPSEQPKLNQNIFCVITIGALIWRKGYEYALLSIRQLVDRNIAVRFNIIGDGPERQRLLYTIYDLKLQKNVSLLGYLSPEQVRNQLQQADVFLLSSLSEGISNAVLEAMACGLPIVTTDCGGMREVVTNGVEGFVVPVRNPEAIADALIQLWEKPDLRKKMGQLARERVLRDFSLKQHIQIWLEFLYHIAIS